MTDLFVSLFVSLVNECHYDIISRNPVVMKRQELVIHFDVFFVLLSILFSE